MPDPLYLLKKWWKPIAALTLLAALLSLLLSMLAPRKYLAVATAAPGSSFASDRSRIFNENIEALYSVLGTADDLDLILGTARLDTVYLLVTDQLQLENAYKVSEQGSARRMKVARILKKNTSVQKSGYGELKIKVKDSDPVRAASIANSLLEHLRSIHQELQVAANRSTLEALVAERARRDSVPGAPVADYDSLISQYQFLVNSKPPVLLTIEAARAPQWPDSPRTLRNVLVGTALAFIFSFLLALYLEKRKNPA